MIQAGGSILQPTPVLALLAGVDEPGIGTPGAKWLQACAARAHEVATMLATTGEARSQAVRLCAHFAVEDPAYDVRRVAADLRVHVRRTHKNKNETQFAAEAALYPVARTLLDRISA